MNAMQMQQQQQQYMAAMQEQQKAYQQQQQQHQERLLQQQQQLAHQQAEAQRREAYRQLVAHNIATAPPNVSSDACLKHIHSWQVEDVKLSVDCRNLFLPTRTDLGNFSFDAIPGISLWVEHPSMPLAHVKTAPYTNDGAVEMSVKFVVSARDILFYAQDVNNCVELQVMQEVLDPGHVYSRNRRRMHAARIDPKLASSSHASDSGNGFNLSSNHAGFHTQSSSQHRSLGRVLLARARVPFRHLLMDAITSGVIGEHRRASDAFAAAAEGEVVDGGGGSGSDGEADVKHVEPAAGAAGAGGATVRAKGIPAVDFVAFHNGGDAVIEKQLRRAQSHASIICQWVRPPRDEGPTVPSGFGKRSASGFVMFLRMCFSVDYPISRSSSKLGSASGFVKSSHVLCVSDPISRSSSQLWFCDVRLLGFNANKPIAQSSSQLWCCEILSCVSVPTSQSYDHQRD
jgi:hypothetical protein